MQHEVYSMHYHDGALGRHCVKYQVQSIKRKVYSMQYHEGAVSRRGVELIREAALLAVRQADRAEPALQPEARSP